ncbi:MAG: hypothetical protein J6I64_01520, partial [Lachnospiraceae bacterium]|nr:hypothetical protein [Lachnospiraceae bacterium]
VLIAILLNEGAYFSGLLATEEFNMFFISRHCPPSLPVYSLIQEILPYPWCLLIYVTAFTAAAGLMLLAAVGIRQLVRLPRASFLRKPPFVRRKAHT